MKIHIVQKGDTLWKIAKKYGVNFEELKKMNSQLSNPDMIMPGMKIKVPTTGGSIKKEAPMGTKPEKTINLGTKKEMPIAEHPFAKEKPVPLPIKEAPIVKEKPIVKEQPIVKEKPIVKEQPIVKEKPIVKEQPIVKEKPIVKEQPIIKEAPKAPFTPKMPLQIIPEIDINNYYTSNMTNMTVPPQLPPKPANILPEVKEEIKKEIPIPPPAPAKEMPVEIPPPQDYCVPITPVMPGPGFCPPFGGMPMMPPVMPYPEVQGAGYLPHPGMVHGTPGFNPAMAGTSVMPGQFFHDESSSFMPQMPGVNPAYNPGAVMGTQTPMMDPAAYGQSPMGYGGFQSGTAPMGYGGVPAGSTQMGFGGAPVPTQMPSEYGGMPAGAAPMQAGYGQNPMGYGEVPAGYGQNPMGYGEAPTGYGQNPMGYGEVPAGYGQNPMGYGEVPAGCGQNPMGYGGMPAGFGQTPMGYGGMPAGYGQMPMGYEGMPGGTVDPMTGAQGYPAQYQGGMSQASPGGPGTMFGNPGMVNPYGMGTAPYGYPQMGGPGPQVMGMHDFESSDLHTHGAAGQMPFMPTAPAQGLPVGTGALNDCGCGGGGGMQPAGMVPTSPPPTSFVPPTPPIYSAPYTGPMNVAHPPYMNPYGVGPAGTNPYGMPGYRDESN
ncbi:SafA/ExsA family spore coat assembly protein [Bacillus sp. ISL-18]|uniref:SafA/ExsA family spore coat assembly protein n=1 Tax=Bacillus sp. ISL-18 TaxID=2819118 RepID=UPI0027E02B1D|nr:SafA/ExsA family spore coat assembly protein [Bacillus sp. ISL-18]